MNLLQKKLGNLAVLSGKRTTFLLGTDQYIGEGLDEYGKKKEVETRVGVVPQQVQEIKTFLQSKGVSLDFYFLKGCGTRADFLDSSYLKIGGKLLFEHELSTIQCPDVVHTLKEPTAYETFIPGPFMRIGALHSGAFDDESGVAFLFKKRNFAAIFDGSNVGEGRNIPIRGVMSIFAGEIAGEFTVKHFIENLVNDAKVVISGAGVVGKSALNILLNEMNDKIKKIILIEPFASTVTRLREEYKTNSKIEIIKGDIITDEQLQNADAVILTAFIKGKSAPNVIKLAQLNNINNKAIVVDVSIDEKGGIKIPNFKKEDVSLSKVIQTVDLSIKKLGKGIKYLADNHMPKHKPKKASIAHGRAIMPYLTLLLYYSAKLNGSTKVAKYIFTGKFDDESEPIKSLFQHLKNGLVFYNPAPIVFNAQIISDMENKQNLRNFFNDNGIGYSEFE